MGKMSLTSCRALTTPGKFSNVDRYAHCASSGDRTDLNSLFPGVFLLNLHPTLWRETVKGKIGGDCHFLGSLHNHPLLSLAAGPEQRPEKGRLAAVWWDSLV